MDAKGLNPELAKGFVKYTPAPDRAKALEVKIKEHLDEFAGRLVEHLDGADDEAISEFWHFCYMNILREYNQAALVVTEGASKPQGEADIKYRDIKGRSARLKAIEAAGNRNDIAHLMSQEFYGTDAYYPSMLDWVDGIQRAAISAAKPEIGRPVRYTDGEISREMEECSENINRFTLPVQVKHIVRDPIGRHISRITILNEETGLEETFHAALQEPRIEDAHKRVGAYLGLHPDDYPKNIDEIEELMRRNYTHEITRSKIWETVAKAYAKLQGKVTRASTKGVSEEIHGRGFFERAFAETFPNIGQGKDGDCTCLASCYGPSSCNKCGDK